MLRSTFRNGLESVLIAAVSLAAFSGCGFSRAAFRTGDTPTQALPAVSPAQVRFYGALPQGVSVHEVGLVVATADADESWLAMRRLRDTAAALGADAVIGLRFEVVQSTVVVAKGIAVSLLNRPGSVGEIPPVAPPAVSKGASPGQPQPLPAPPPKPAVAPPPVGSSPASGQGAAGGALPSSADGLNHNEQAPAEGEK